jgi:hypothetical protein
LVVGLSLLALLLVALACCCCCPWCLACCRRRRRRKKEEDKREEAGLNASHPSLPWALPGLHFPGNNDVKLIDVKPCMPPPYSPPADVGHPEPEPVEGSPPASPENDGPEPSGGSPPASPEGGHPEPCIGPSPTQSAHSDADAVSMTSSRNNTPSKQTRTTSLSDMELDCDWQ